MGHGAVYLIRDNDGAFRPFSRPAGGGWESGSPDITKVALAKSSCRTPDRDARRDCFDHVLIFGEQHLRQILTLYSRYYNEARHTSAEEGYTTTEAFQRTGTNCHADPIRIASSLRADMIFGKDGLKDQPVDAGEGQTARGLSAEHIQLVPEHQDFGFQLGPRSEEPSESA